MKIAGDGEPLQRAAPADPARMGALLTDLYQLTMLDAYLEEGMDAPALALTRWP